MQLKAVSFDHPITVWKLYFDVHINPIMLKSLQSKRIMDRIREPRDELAFWEIPFLFVFRPFSIKSNQII